jgi:hypothetical protein
MADFLANRVHVDATSSGLTDFTLGAAISGAYQSFSGAGVPNGATFPYTAYTATQFECGTGAYSTTGPTLDRTNTNVIAGSAGAGSLVDFTSNPRVFIGPLAELFAATRAINVVFDGSSSGGITTGIKGDLPVPYNCRITGVTMLADQSGSIVVDILKSNYAGFPPTTSIIGGGGTKPTISSNDQSQDTSMTGWTTVEIDAGDILRFEVVSVTAITRLTMALNVSVL